MLGLGPHSHDGCVVERRLSDCQGGEVNAMWFVIGSDNWPIPCHSQVDAERFAVEWDTTLPRHAPHRAVQLVDAKELDALRAEVARLEQCAGWEQYRAERVGTHGTGCATWGSQHYQCALRELDALRAERDALLADAMRYEYLRDAGDPNLCVRGEEEVMGRGGYEPSYYREMIFGSALNAAIDAALRNSHEQ